MIPSLWSLIEDYVEASIEFQKAIDKDVPIGDPEHTKAQADFNTAKGLLTERLDTARRLLS